MSGKLGLAACLIATGLLGCGGVEAPICWSAIAAKQEIVKTVEETEELLMTKEREYRAIQTTIDGLDDRIATLEQRLENASDTRRPTIEAKIAVLNERRSQQLERSSDLREMQELVCPMARTSLEQTRDELRVLHEDLAAEYARIAGEAALDRN